MYIDLLIISGLEVAPPLEPGPGDSCPGVPPAVSGPADCDTKTTQHLSGCTL